MKTFHFIFVFLILPGFTITTSVRAQDHQHPQQDSTAQQDHHMHDGHMQHNNAMDHMTPADQQVHIGMPHAFSLSLPMNRNGSGTGWLPDNAPMYGYMLHTKKWMYMFHGSIFLRYNKQDATGRGTRGDDLADAPNWFMAMGQRKVGKRGLFRFSSMISLDPLTVGGEGYPLLYQSGETWKGKPLVDRQHPHDLFSELSVAYTHQFTPHTDAFVYLAYPGEPALGPVAFMHRVSSQYNPDAPIGHHWQDATHITFGVATLGIRHKKVKLEGSVFTGREPNEERYGFDRPRFDSYSVRFSYNPSSAWALQASQAWMNDVHESGPREDIRKTTASAIHSLPLGAGKFLNSTVVWGYNQAGHHNAAHSVLAESALTLHKTALYGKYEWVQKSAGDLLLEDIFGHDRLFNAQGITLGIQQDLAQVLHTNLAAGVQGSWYPTLPDLAETYGNNPLAFEVYIRFYPGLMSSGARK